MCDIIRFYSLFGSGVLQWRRWTELPIFSDCNLRFWYAISKCSKISTTEKKKIEIAPDNKNAPLSLHQTQKYTVKRVGSQAANSRDSHLNTYPGISAHQ